jgi:hypothetical protein
MISRILREAHLEMLSKFRGSGFAKATGWLPFKAF